jgi:hypothetical protein
MTRSRPLTRVLDRVDHQVGLKNTTINTTKIKTFFIIIVLLFLTVHLPGKYSYIV